MDVITAAISAPVDPVPVPGATPESPLERAPLPCAEPLPRAYRLASPPLTLRDVQRRIAALLPESTIAAPRIGRRASRWHGGAE